MKKTFSFLVGLIFILSTYLSLSQPVFSKRYNLPMRSSQFIDVAADGGYFFCGQSMLSFDAVIGKIDFTGQVIWAKSFSTPGFSEEPYSMITLANGNVVVAILSNNGIAQDLKTRLISLDLNGNVLFMKRYTNVNSDPFTPWNMIRDGGGFTLSVNNYNTWENHVMKLDSMGNRLYGLNSFLGGIYATIFLSDNQGYFLFPSSGIPLMDVFDTSFVHQGTFVMDMQPLYLRGVIKNSNQTFFGFGADGLSGNNDPCIFKFNSQMQMTWKKHYQLPSPLKGMIETACKTGPNSIIFKGHTSNPVEMPFLLQTDTMGILQRSIFINIPSLYNELFSSNICYNNGQLTFIHNEILPQTGACYFKINSVDSLLAPLCNIKDTPVTAFSNMLFPPVNITNSFFTNNDSLIDDSLMIINISFLNSFCNDSTLYVNENEDTDPVFSVYPNPAFETISINTGVMQAKTGDLTIFDLWGRKVFYRSHITSGKTNIPITFLSKGLYLLTFNSDNNIEWVKLVKN